MTDGFQPRRGGGALAALTGFEADLLRSLAAQLVELLHDDVPRPVEVDPFESLLDFSGPTSPPEDPVLRRLLPTAYREDDEAAADFRRYTEPELRTGKAGNAHGVISSLEAAGLPPELDEAGLMIDVELDAGESMAWLKTLTDMRLALGTRLGVEEGDEARWESLPDDDPRVQIHDIYDWLGYLQETLVDALSR